MRRNREKRFQQVVIFILNRLEVPYILEHPAMASFVDLCDDQADTISICTLNLQEEEQDFLIKDINQLKSLPKQFTHIHSNFLYYRNNSDIGKACFDTWKNLVLLTTEVWEDFGFASGITEDEIKFIKCSQFTNPFDIVLKVFVQNKNATMDKFLNIYVKLERFDILSKMRVRLNNLSTHFAYDSGYMSKDNGRRKIISNDKYVSDLPVVLNKNISYGVSGVPNKQMPVQQVLTRTDTDHGYTLFLTFAEDGCRTAENIKHYVKKWEDFPPVTIITLDDIKEKVTQNAGKYIRECFEKADYVVPILTPGYFNKIQSEESVVPNTTERLDFQYVNFIFNILSGFYNASGCINKKVRCVLPEKTDVSLIVKVLKMFPEFQPWTYEKKFDEEFKVYLEYKPS